LKRRIVKQFISYDWRTKENTNDLDDMINKYAEENNLTIVQITFSRCIQALVLFEEEAES